jgi:hypothetical protein
MVDQYTAVHGTSNPVTAAASTTNGVVSLVATLAYTDTVAKTLFTIPDGGVIVQWILNVTTNFDSDGTDQVDIGVTGTAEKFAANIDVSTTGLKTTGVVLSQVGIAQSGAQIVKGIYAAGGSAASQGAMTIIVQYTIPG